jgi:hypothetical protein
MADCNVFNYDYDIVINNDKDLEEFKNKAICFVDDFFNDQMKKEY